MYSLQNAKIFKFLKRLDLMSAICMFVQQDGVIFRAISRKGVFKYIKNSHKSVERFIPEEKQTRGIVPVSPPH